MYMRSWSEFLLYFRNGLCEGGSLILSTVNIVFQMLCLDFPCFRSYYSCAVCRWSDDPLWCLRCILPILNIILMISFNLRGARSTNSSAFLVESSFRVNTRRYVASVTTIVVCWCQLLYWSILIHWRILEELYTIPSCGVISQHSHANESPEDDHKLVA